MEYTEVYDSQTQKNIEANKAIKEIKKDNTKKHLFFCPYCKTKKSALTIVQRENGTFFKLLNNGKHTNPKCKHGKKLAKRHQANKKRFTKKVKLERNFLKDPTNVKAFNQSLKDKLFKQLKWDTQTNSNINIPLASNKKSISNVTTKPQKNKTKTSKINKPHRFLICKRSIKRIDSLLKKGTFSSQNTLPIGMFGQIKIKGKSKSINKYENFKVYDQDDNLLFSWGIDKTTEVSLIDCINTNLDTTLYLYSTFQFYKKNGFLNAYINSPLKNTNIFLDKDNQIFPN